MITSKLFKVIRDLSVQHKTLIVQVKDEEGLKQSIIEHFKELDNEVSDYKDLNKKHFYFVAEVAPFFENEDTNDRLKELVQSLATLENLKKWILFIIVTQHPIKVNPNAMVNLEIIQDTPLAWSDLTEAAKTHLFTKSLILEGSKMAVRNKSLEARELEEGITDHWETSLQALGLKEETIGEWLSPVYLAELIIHDETRPLCLGLPEYDAETATNYIYRHVKLPLMKTDKMSDDLKQRLAFNEDDYSQKLIRKNNPRPYHFLKLVDSIRGYYLSLNSSNSETDEFYRDLKDHTRK